MIGILGVGFLIGMAHAFEADHLAAMGGLAAKDRTRGWRDLVSRGCAWGLGHTITLFFVCGAVILLGTSLTPSREAQLEFAVGQGILWCTREYQFSRERPFQFRNLRQPRRQGCQVQAVKHHLA